MDAVASYRLVVDRDWGEEYAAARSMQGFYVTPTNANLYRPKLEKLRLAALRVREDLSSATVPGVLQQTDAELKQSLDDLLAAVAMRESALDRGDYNTAAEGGKQAIDKAVSPEGRLNELVATVDCYPRHVNFSDTADRWVCINA